MSHQLLIEIGVEELPPSEMPTVLPALEDAVRHMLDELRLSAGGLRILATPRRLAFAVTDLATAQASRVVSIVGPPKKAAFNADGKPTKAAEGFARTHAVTIEQLIEVHTDRGEYLAVERAEPGRPAAEVLPAAIERLIMDLPFAKRMRWGEGDARFARPIRWIVALLDRLVLPLSIAGVTAARRTFGHRFLGPPNGFELPSADAGNYVDALAEAHVIADVATRRGRIRDALARAVAAPLHVVEDDETIDRIVHLVEAPAPVVGTFPERFLTLPRQVVEMPIRQHQKSFTVEGPEGTLVPMFVTISNMPTIADSDIRRGNERVIKARLADADFYFREDLRLTPEARIPLLRGVVFQERLGTMAEKADRLVSLVEFLGTDLATEERAVCRRAAQLAKTDLTSGMVREFPELQGIIGEEYALRASEPLAVGRAIREHYLPRSADDELPGSRPGAILAIADKIDTVVGCIGVGLMPTGSQDPFGLRRQANGVIQIALATDFGPALSLSALVDRALGGLEGKLTESTPDARARVLEFLRARMMTILTSPARWRNDVVEAVLVAGFDNPADVVKRIEALTALMARHDWEPLVVTFKRTVNILPLDVTDEVLPERFIDEAERVLYAETTARRERVRQATAEGRYADALSELAALRPAVDSFFDSVLVMAKDHAIQANRLALLKAIAGLLLPIADLRRIHSPVSLPRDAPAN